MRISDWSSDVCSSDLVQQHGLPSGRADAAIAFAAGELIATYDEGDSLEACCMRLARRLDAAGRLDDAVLVLVLEDGLLPLFIAAIGVRSGLDYPAAWEVLRSEEHTSELQSLMRNPYAVLFLKNKTQK